MRAQKSFPATMYDFDFFCAKILPALSFSSLVVFLACAVTRLLIHLRSREGIPKAARANKNKERRAVKQGFEKVKKSKNANCS